MDEKIALELVRCMLEDGKIEFRLGVLDSESNEHFIVSIAPHKPNSRFEEIMESVLYPASTTTCRLCGK